MVQSLSSAGPLKGNYYYYAITYARASTFLWTAIHKSVLRSNKTCNITPSLPVQSSILLSLRKLFKKFDSKTQIDFKLNDV
jgi:hypothetical protein